MISLWEMFKGFFSFKRRFFELWGLVKGVWLGFFYFSLFLVRSLGWWELGFVFLGRFSLGLNRFRVDRMRAKELEVGFVRIFRVVG